MLVENEMKCRFIQKWENAKESQTKMRYKVVEDNLTNTIEEKADNLDLGYICSRETEGEYSL